MSRGRFGAVADLSDYRKSFGLKNMSEHCSNLFWSRTIQNTLRALGRFPRMNQ